MFRLNHGYKDVFVNKKVKNVSYCKNIQEKNLVVVLDFIAVANLKFPIHVKGATRIGG